MVFFIRALEDIECD